MRCKQIKWITLILTVLLYAAPNTISTWGEGLVPSASGTNVYQGDKVLLDASNISQGYVMVKYTGGNTRFKVQIEKNEGTTYTYDLKKRDCYEVFPLSEGDGSYSVRVYENVYDNQYTMNLNQNFTVTMDDPFLPFLYPNQYVNFTENGTAAKKAEELAAGAQDDFVIVQNIYDYVVGNITYDAAKIQNVKTGYLPDVDQIIVEGRGICFDYASLLAAMLRSRKIPTKLVVGYSAGLYHAWINVYLDSVGWVDNMIYFDGNSWTLMDPTFASSSKKSEAIMEFIGNVSNYQSKYTY